MPTEANPITQINKKKITTDQTNHFPSFLKIPFLKNDPRLSFLGDFSLFLSQFLLLVGDNSPCSSREASRDSFNVFPLLRFELSDVELGADDELCAVVELSEVGLNVTLLVVWKGLEWTLLLGEFLLGEMLSGVDGESPKSAGFMGLVSWGRKKREKKRRVSDS